MTLLEKLKAKWNDLARDQGPIMPLVELTTSEWELGTRLGIDTEVLMCVKSVASPLGPIHAVDAVGGGLSNVFAVDVSTTFAREALRELRHALSALNWHAFYCDRTFSHVSIVIMQTRDPFDVLRLRGTHGQSNLPTDKIIHRLQSWDHQFGVVVVGAGPQWVELDFVDQPSDLKTFAAEVAGFCPYTLASNHDSIDELVAQMVDSGGICLRWD